jgi:hypothetical protein
MAQSSLAVVPREFSWLTNEVVHILEIAHLEMGNRGRIELGVAV